MKTMIFLVLVVLSVAMIPSAPVQAGNGSEECVTSCGDAADETCGEDKSCRSAYFNGCMMTCWM